MPGSEKTSSPPDDGVVHHPQRTRKLIVLAVSAILVATYLLQDQLLASFSSTSLSWLNDGDAEDWTQLAAGTVKWWDCAGKGGAMEGAECGYIIVPTDYFDPTAGITKIALGRYKAKKGPRQGIVLVNPGGPGGSGKSLCTAGGSFIQTAITGETYDIIGFDPRGIGETEPTTQCFDSPVHAAQLKANTVLDKGFDVGGNLSSPGLRQSLMRQQIEADSIYRVQYAMCGRNMGQKLKYMGTSFVVRDIDFITQTLEGQGTLINFWGVSYGSILGQYLVNMLPDRLGRVVIDGIADAVAWSSEPNYKWYRPWLSSTEKAYDIFLTGCAAVGPTVCPLAKHDSEDPSNIRARLEAWFDKLYEKPLAVPDPSYPGTMTSGMARKYLFEALEVPRSWPSFATVLAAAMYYNNSLLLKTHNRNDIPDMNRQAVSCNDALPLTPITAPSNDDILDELIDVLQTETKFAMSVVTAEPDSGCQYWPVSPPERFSGPWNHTLRNPIIVFSNTADPVTPISSARLVKSLLKDSAVLALQDAPGHCTIALPSICTIRKARAYFESGTLPEDGHTCQVSVKPFSSGDELQAFSEAERGVLDASMQLGELVSGLKRMM